MHTPLHVCLAASLALLTLAACQPVPRGDVILSSPVPRGDVILSSFNIKSSNPGYFNEWKENPNPVETPAVLTLPASADDDAQHPVVVYLPSSGGIGKHDKRWQKMFLKNGYAVFQIDQYSNRGMSLRTGLGKKQSGMSDMSYLNDLYAGVRYLKNHPRIAPDRIALFGRSWGGGIQVYTMMDWYRAMLGEGLDVAARIALYPACYMTIEAPTPTAGKTLFLLGGKDDWNAPEQCIDFASRVKSAGGDVTVEVLPNAVHGWDGGRVETIRGVAVWGRECHILWDPSTMKIWSSGASEKFDLSDGWGDVWDCVVKGSVKVGGTSEQRRKTEEIVFSFLSENL